MNEEQELNPETGLPIVPFKLEPTEVTKYTVIHDNITIHLDTIIQVKKYIKDMSRVTVYENRIIFDRIPMGIKVDRL